VVSYYCFNFKALLVEPIPSIADQFAESCRQDYLQHSAEEEESIKIAQITKNHYQESIKVEVRRKRLSDASALANSSVQKTVQFVVSSQLPCRVGFVNNQTFPNMGHYGCVRPKVS
jgi:hypothetical protein